MAANEFEKNVRTTMDEFRLHPSEEVWQKVELRIREKERKRRIIFFIFSLLGLAIAGSGIYFYSNLQHTKPGVEKTNLTGKKQNTNEKQASSAGTNHQPRISSAPGGPSEATRTGEYKSNEQAPYVNGTSKRKAPGARMMAKKDLAEKSVRPVRPSRENEIKGDVVRNADRVAGQEVSVQDNRFSPIDSVNQRMISTELHKDVATNSGVDTLRNQENKKGEPSAQTEMVPPHDHFSRNLKWGLNFSAGSSTIGGSRFSLKSSGVASAFFTNSPGTNTGGVATQYPPQNRWGFAFKTGIAIKKNLSARSSFSFGLSYVYLSDKIKIGTQRSVILRLSNADSISSYYAGMPQKDFTDAFHFLELPLVYSWRMSANPRHFFSLETGLSLSRLISTNALIYDTSGGGIYYHHQDLLNRTHLSLISGIAYNLSGLKHFELNIGPQISFDLSQILKSDIDKRKYFLYAGVGAHLLFVKKENE